MWVSRLFNNNDESTHVSLLHSAGKFARQSPAFVASNQAAESDGTLAKAHFTRSIPSCTHSCGMDFQTSTVSSCIRGTSPAVNYQSQLGHSDGFQFLKEARDAVHAQVEWTSRRSQLKLKSHSDFCTDALGLERSKKISVTAWSVSWT